MLVNLQSCEHEKLNFFILISMSELKTKYKVGQLVEFKDSGANQPKKGEILSACWVYEATPTEVSVFTLPADHGCIPKQCGMRLPSRIVHSSEPLEKKAMRSTSFMARETVKCKKWENLTVEVENVFIGISYRVRAGTESYWIFERDIIADERPIS